MDASKKILLSLIKFPCRTFVREVVRSAGGISVKKPRFPRLMPKIGILLYPKIALVNFIYRK